MGGMRIRHAAWLVALTLGLIACTGPAGTATSGPSPTASLAPPATSTPTSGSSGAPAAGQTDTEWGRIWDALPVGFPTFPGATSSDEGATGPASAILVIDGNVARDVTTTTESKLKEAGYRTEALSGPLEDGTFTLEVTGPAAGCRVKVTAQPTGGLTTITILYGAACPKP